MAHEGLIGLFCEGNVRLPEVINTEHTDEVFQCIANDVSMRQHLNSSNERKIYMCFLIFEANALT